MTAEEAAELISSMAEALRSNPSDFNIRVMVVGMRATGGDGAPGAVGIAHGGGTGISVTASGGNVEITQGEAAFTEELGNVSDALQELAEAARGGDEGRAKRILISLKTAAALPVSILATVEAVLRLAKLA